MRWYTWAGLIVVAAIALGYFFIQSRLSSPYLSEDEIAQRRADAAAQDETAFKVPAPRPAETPDTNPLRNVYFGDLHAHSNLSFDSNISGNRLTVDDSYRVAKGEAVENIVGEVMQLTRPLDFAAMTDHAEGFGMHEACHAAASGSAMGDLCGRLEYPDSKLYMYLRREGEKRPPVSLLGETLKDRERERFYSQQTWKNIASAAERHNEPGKFTTFVAYEYSPPLPDRGKIHRNVIFRNANVPAYAVSAFDALTELDLWKQLSDTCADPCEFLTIPHNPNKSWGLAFTSHTVDGDEYTIDDWRMRDRWEPLVEMFQIKGNSECALGFGTSDEECGFEQFFARCEEGQETKCIFETSMARDGLKIGLELQEELGFNPLDFGMIGSTDTHNSNPGDTEEWDARGASGYFTAPARHRLKKGQKGPYARIRNNPGGLAAVWAEENTRDSLFASMRRKEVYATSGTRIRLRFFGGLNYEDELIDAEDMVFQGYANGVAMGGTLQAKADRKPSFIVWAQRDLLDAPLDRIQIVKGWRENGEGKEQVFDILCSDGRTATSGTHRCEATKANVDLATCAFDNEVGEDELKTIWTDPSYRTDQDAFYYVRVIQNPTCRWSTYDGLRLGQEPPANVPATVTEMAWSSPIWIKGNK